jgi:hypothetical protein
MSETTPPQPAARPSERIWPVECYVTDPERGLTLPDPIGMREAMFEAQAILTRAGGVLQIAAERTKDFPAPGLTSTTRLLFRWQSFVPISQRDDFAPVAAAPNGAEPAPAEPSAAEEPEPVAG